MEALHQDIILNHILLRLDGRTLAYASCTSTTLRDLISSNSHQLWSNVCLSTWQSINSPRLRHIISTFPPDGPRSFFSQSCFPQPLLPSRLFHRRRLSGFISAVDIRYKDSLIFSKTLETTETETSWFRCAPFRIDLVDQKDFIQTAVKHPATDYDCRELLHDLKLSWIVIDPVNNRAANITSSVPVSVQRHWLSGEAMVQFASVLGGGQYSTRNKESASELVNCGIVVTLGGAEDGRMQVREVSLVLEDIDGKHLCGESSLVNLEWALEGNKRKLFEEFLEKKRNKKEMELRREERLDLLCVAFGVTLLSSVFMLFVFHW